MFKKIVAGFVIATALVGGAVGCTSSPADTVSHNISKDADQFRVPRKIIFFTGVTNPVNIMLTIEGYCSLGNNDPVNQITVTCKVGPNEYKKHFLGLQGNTSYFVEQVAPIKEDPYHYKVFIRPSTVIPNFESGKGAGN